MLADPPRRNSDLSADANGILAKLRTCLGSRFEDARPMPGEIYHAPEVTALERDRIFMREWICVARASDLAVEGAFVTERIVDVPVLLVVQANGTIAAFLNACAHRFAQVVHEPSGRKKLFVCPYHAWSYDPAGRLVRAPHMEDAPGFEQGDVSLRSLHTEIWQGFVYVSLSHERPAPLSERLADITKDVFDRYNMAAYETVHRDEMPVAANWKNMIENFVESYHLFAVHTETFATAGKSPDVYTCGPDMGSCAFHWSAKESDEGLGVAHPDNTALTGDWRRTIVVGCIFPNHLITLAPDYLWSVTVLPEAQGRMRAAWSVSVAPEVLKSMTEAGRDAWVSDLIAFMDTANAEDKPVIEALYQGTRMASGPGHYHRIERNIWNFATYLDRMLRVSGP